MRRALRARGRRRAARPCRQSAAAPARKAAARRDGTRSRMPRCVCGLVALLIAFLSRSRCWPFARRLSAGDKRFERGLNGRPRGAKHTHPQSQWGAWRSRAERRHRQPIEPDPDHAGGGSLRCGIATTSRQTTPPRPVLTSSSPAAAAAVLERIRTRAPRVHCITNAVAQNFSANMLLALGAVPVDDDRARRGWRVRGARRRAARQSRHVRCGTPGRGRDRDRERRTRPIGRGCSIRCSSSARNRARRLPGRWLARHPQRAAAQSGRVCGACRCAMERGRAARLRIRGRRCAGTDGRNRPRHRRSTARAHRQWASADGQGHRHGVLGVARSSRPALRSKPTRGLRPRPR